jgi:hypothetical protein
VFLSSVFKDQFGDDYRYVPLRRRILNERRTLPVSLWAYDHFWPENSEKPDPDADTIIDRCFDGIRSCDLFVYLLTKRHGSGVTYFADPAQASYLELELFAASALRKPIVVLHERGHEPDPVLHDTLLLLNRAFQTGEYTLDDEDGLYGRFREICDALAAGTLTLGRTAVMAHLPEWLSVRRTESDPEKDILDPRLYFLDGRLQAENSTADPDRALRLLDQVSAGVRVKAGHRAPLPHGAALFRLWAAMRELMTDKSVTTSDPATAVLWDRALGLWAGKASWFGLHGHVWMGPLAAINSQTELRTAFSNTPSYVAAQDVREPLGARASAIYSIAQRMDTRGRKLWHYGQVVELATLAVERDPGAQQGALSIRGHALMRMARLGQLWKLWDASVDFRKSYELRAKAGASSASLGEALADLGFCMVLTGRLRSGLSMLREGVDLMRSDTSVNGKAFLARGLRKLESAAKLSGAWSTMRNAREERLALSDDIQALDQAREAWCGDVDKARRSNTKIGDQPVQGSSSLSAALRSNSARTSGCLSK